MAGRLVGRTVVVTRAGEQAGTLRARLEAEGAAVIELATIATVDPADGGRALRVAAAGIERYDWVVVTSPNGARRLADALAAVGSSAPRSHLPRLAVIGPGTADACSALGLTVALVPERFVAEGLLAVFPPAGSANGGRVLVAQAASARPVLADGLRRAGWSVEVVEAYRTVTAAPTPAARSAVAGADAVTFTSGSTVTGFVAALGLAGLPPVVVCIGPVTASEAAALGVPVAEVATEHDLAGLVEAVVRALA